MGKMEIVESHVEIVLCPEMKELVAIMYVLNVIVKNQEDVCVQQLLHQCQEPSFLIWMWNHVLVDVKKIKIHKKDKKDEILISSFLNSKY